MKKRKKRGVLSINAAARRRMALAHPASHAVPSQFFITAESGESDFELVAADGADTGADPPPAGEAAKSDGPKKFKMTAYTGGRLQLANFPHPVVVDLAGMKVPARSRPILRQHDPNRIVGHSTDVKVNDGSIKLAGVLSAANDSAREVADSAKNGFPWQSSIGAKASKMAYVDRGENVQVNGRSFTGPLYVARQSVLGEVSFVPIGADEGGATATITASLNTAPPATGKDPNMKFEQWLEAKGFVLADLNDTQKASLQAAFDAEIKAATAPKPGIVPEEEEDDDDDDPVKAARIAAAAEVQRIADVREICAKYGAPKFKVQGQEIVLEAHAIAEGWDRDKTELHALRESRQKAPAAQSHSHEASCTVQAMEGAMLLRAGMKLDNKAYNTPQAVALRVPRWLRASIDEDARQQIMEAAHRFSEMSMYDVAAEAVRLDGKYVPSGKRETIEAAFSGSSLSSIFTTNVNTIILATYLEALDNTGGWTREAEVNDFKLNERPRMAKGANLVRLPAGGEADHYSRSDSEETYKIARYAKQFVVDEQDFINDSFSALSDTPREMGLAAGRLRPDLVYAILLANAALGADSVALFNASHSNLNTGAALADATLKAAIAALEKQQETSVNLDLRASHLIVPSDLKHTAAAILHSAQVFPTGTTTDRIGTDNTVATEEEITLVSSARLANGVTDPSTGTFYAGSSSTWYLASERGHNIEVGYLKGTGRAPQVRSFFLERGQWGMGWDVKMDIGAKSLDYRGMQKNTA